MGFISHDEAVRRSIEFLGSGRAETAKPLFVLIHGRAVAAELEKARAELVRLRAIEARVQECTNEFGTVGPITAHYVLTGAPFGKDGA